MPSALGRTSLVEQGREDRGTRPGLRRWRRVHRKKAQVAHGGIWPFSRLEVTASSDCITPAGEGAAIRYGPPPAVRSMQLM